jgi:hypothetical protein
VVDGAAVDGVMVMVMVMVVVVVVMLLLSVFAECFQSFSRIGGWA